MAFNFNWKPQDLSYQQYQFLSNPDEAFKNRTNTKQAQEMLGFEGNGIDGVAGKATRDAYNKQMRYYNDLYGNVSKAGSLDLNDPNAFYNDIHDAETYGFTPQEAENELNADILAEKQQQEAAAKEQQIADIESQISALEKRITENTAKLQKWTGNADQIAAIEARKINSQDPTSIWRWKQGQEQAAEEARKTREQALALREADLERAKAEKDIQDAKRAQNTRYKIDAGLKKMAIDLNTTPEQLQSYINDAADLEALGLTDDVGEEYMNKIWDAQEKLKGPLPSIKAGELANNFNVLDSQFDTVESQGGFGKNRNKYVEAVDKNWKDIQDFYGQFGQEVPLDVRKAYIAARNKHNKKKTSPKPGAPMKPRG